MTMLIKSPVEVKHQTVIFRDAAEGATLTNVDVVSTAKGLASGPALVHAEQIASPTALVSVSTGTDGEIYRLDVTGTFDDGAVLEESFEIQVMDLDWRVPDPDGQVSYITPEEYFERFSLEEAITATDREGLGRLDVTAFRTALADASAMIDAALADRYIVPLSPVPRPVKVVACNLVREILHIGGGNVPDDVEMGAKNARKQLDNMAKGATLLSNAEGKSATVDTPLFEGGGQVFSNDALKGF